MVWRCSIDNTTRMIRTLERWAKDGCSGTGGGDVTVAVANAAPHYAGGGSTGHAST